MDDADLHAIIAACRARTGHLDLRWTADDLTNAVVHLAERLRYIEMDSYSRGHEDGRNGERADIASWLRWTEPKMTAEELARAIERGDHHDPDFPKE